MYEVAILRSCFVRKRTDNHYSIGIESQLSKQEQCDKKLTATRKNIEKEGLMYGAGRSR